jgi:hypothetical protein
MWVVLGMFIQFLLKDQELVGNPCQEIGAKIGKVTLILMDKVSHFKLQQVMVELPQVSMWHQAIGNLVKLFKELNFRLYNMII